MDKPKIKISDNNLLRNKLVHAISDQSQLALSVWTMACVFHLTDHLSQEITNDPRYKQAIETIRLWQNGNVAVKEVRQAGFKVHELAREATDPVSQCILRALGQAIGVGHMKEHAVVCTDYIIKAINLLAKNDTAMITKEREYQLYLLTGCADKNS
ncbi:MAG: putative immunity protein [Anaerofustis sp.]